MKPACYRNKKPSARMAAANKFLSAMAEDNRLKILCLLRQGELCVCEIWQHLGLPQNLTSHHLAVLKKLKLITSRREGLRIYYCANKKVMKQYLSKLETIMIN